MLKKDLMFTGVHVLGEKMWPTMMQFITDYAESLAEGRE
jgi:hypothetical protein